MKKNNNKNKGLGIFVLVLTVVVACLAVVLFLGKTNNKTENKTLAYTDLIKQIAEKNVNKVEMVTGTTSIKVTLKKEIDEKGNIVQGGVEYKEKDKKETENAGIITIIENINTQKSEEETKIEEKLVKNAIIPNTESFIELIQDEVAKGNDIELIQKAPSFLTKLPSVLFSLLPTIIMVALFVMIFKIFCLS